MMNPIVKSFSESKNMVEKNFSPFFPGQPLPADSTSSFVGRKKEFERILRSIKEVERGKQKMIFLSGEYGIGKSSFAQLLKITAERDHGLFGIHVLLNGAKTIDDISKRTLEEIVQSPTYRSSLSEKIRGLLGKYIDSAEIGVPGIIKLKTENIKADAPNISSGYLPFLGQVLEKLKEDGTKGIFLIFDDLNGITRSPEFAHFIKDLVDKNAFSKNPIPILLMLCGVAERRVEMVNNFQPIERIFEIVDVGPVSEDEMRQFFLGSFQKADHAIDEESLKMLCRFSAGFPKIMHVIGENVYWTDKDGKITLDDAKEGVLEAAQEIGRRVIDQQVYKVLKSDDYRSILAKLTTSDLDLSFRKSDTEKRLSESEKKKFHNFLAKMKKIGVLKEGATRGEYVFRSLLEKLYFMMNGLKDKSEK